MVRISPIFFVVLQHLLPVPLNGQPKPVDAEHVKLVFRNDSIERRSHFEGDNWHTTWAADGHQYVLQCDGQGYNTQLWKLVGPPSNFHFEHVWSHPGPKEIPDERYYGFGILGVGPAIYHYYSTPDKWYTDPPWNFIGAKLVYSPDTGRTWRNQDGTTPVIFETTQNRDRKNMIFFKEPDNSFSLLTMLQMGKGYELNKDGFIYVYAPNGGTEGTMNELVMYRVHKDKLLSRTAYEFFAGTEAGGIPKWSADIEKRQPVHTFPQGYVNRLKHPYSWHPSVVYNAGLNLYMMANWGVGVDSSGVWFTRPSYLGIYVSKNPWGPWQQIHEDIAWFPPGGTIEGQCYQPQIMPGWIAEDGKSFWLAWTQYPKGYYFQTQRVDIVEDTERRVTGPLHPLMVSVEGGTFMMGDTSGLADADERPLHKVTVSDFSISQTEVTVKQWKQYVQNVGMRMPEPPAWGWEDSHPIVNVTWEEAQAYCKWLSAKTKKNYRLPTEAEWEYAARGGKHANNFPYSGSASADAVAWYSANSNTTHPVATKKSNGLGLYDMSGNAWEWCGDYFSKYSPASSDNPHKASGIFVVRRGGSWDDVKKRARITYRMGNTPRRSYHTLGFRVACSP
jgi:formylglycine-generating enzyme required for sulfatase activity